MCSIDLTFRFESGKSYPLVGASGSGKSTLLNLLMAAHDTSGEDICYDEHELRLISSDSLFDLVSVVSSRMSSYSRLPSGIISPCFAPLPQRRRGSRDSAVSACLPLMEEKGEAYLCGENGSGLSGGERHASPSPEAFFEIPMSCWPMRPLPPWIRRRPTTWFTPSCPWTG